MCDGESELRMFVRDFVYIRRPFETVAPRFVRDPAWLDPLVAAAVGVTTGRCERGTARHHADTLVVPVRWVLDEAAPNAWLDGDLLIAPVGHDECQIALTAQSAADENSETRVRDVRAKEAAMRAFLNGLAAALTAGTPPPP